MKKTVRLIALFAVVLTVLALVVACGRDGKYVASDGSYYEFSGEKFVSYDSSVKAKVEGTFHIDGDKLRLSYATEADKEGQKDSTLTFYEDNDGNLVIAGKKYVKE